NKFIATIFICISILSKIKNPQQMMWSISVFFLVLLNSHTGFSLTSDGLSLLSLKSAMDDGGGGTVFSGWNENDDTPCTWTGISCANISGSSEPRVVGITLSCKNLRGYLPSELGTLLYLRRLNLHGNNIYGSIPDPLFNATSLHSIYLYDNNISGSYRGLF
ncbi:hypothetical protein AABB24_029844, partial [Solanum stoloniferum]